MKRQILCWNCHYANGSTCRIANDDISLRPRTRCNHFEKMTEDAQYCQCSTCIHELGTMVLDESAETSYIQHVICTRHKKMRTRQAERDCKDYQEVVIA